METKELKIIPPEGYEIDKENSTLNCIKFIKKNNITYQDVIKTLFSNKWNYFLNSCGEIIENIHGFYLGHNSSTSKRQLEKLLAINKLMNVAKYLNDGWRPDWNKGSEYKWYLIISNKTLFVNCCWKDHSTNIYFKSRELAEQAIKILGEDTICLALSTDW